jgi:ferredoxin-NADP reductase
MRADRNWTVATIAGVRDVARNVREFRLKPQAGTAMYPTGSHLAVRVVIDGKTDLRYYSLIGATAKDGIWTIAVKREEPGRGGSRYMWSLAPGARLEVAEPDSHFSLSLSASEYLLIAGGIGVTPMVGMAETLVRLGAKVRMLYAGRDPELMPYRDELASILGDRLDLACSGEGRRIDLAREFAGLDAKAEVYLCGPIRLLEGARAAWQAAGRPRDRLIYETFGSSGRYASEDFTVRVPSLDLDVVVPADTSMLAALEAAGVGVLSDCRRGECGLCAIDVVSCTGMIDHRDVFFSDAQHEEGRKICACVSRVTGGSISVEPPYRVDAPLRSGRELTSA